MREVVVTAPDISQKPTVPSETPYDLSAIPVCTIHTILTHHRATMLCTNLPFAERRGRVQAKRRTQGMHEIQRNKPSHNNPPSPSQQHSLP